MEISLIKQYKDKTVITVSTKNGIERKVKLIVGGEYVIRPVNSKKLKNRDRKVLLAGFLHDERFGLYAKVKYLDTNRTGKADIIDLDYL